MEYGAQVNVYDEDGSSPLHIATERGFIPEMELLIENSADISAQKNGSTLLHIGLRSPWPSLEVVKFLVQKSPESVSITDKEGQTPLSLAQKYSYDEIAQFLSEV